MAFVDAFELALTIKRDIDDIMKWLTYMSLLTDSLLLFDAFTISCTSREKRLMIDVQTVKVAYQFFAFNDVALFGQKSILAMV